jgi:hypothetical protein
MLWTNNVNLNIIAYNDRYIDCYVDCTDTDPGWRATGLYGFSSQQQKPETCDLIKNLFQNTNHDHWLLFGDFNMVLNHAEKLGGRDINSSHTNLFQDTLNDCNMQDIGWHGDIYTWSNNQETSHHIKERLDRFCASSAWLSKFPRSTNYHLPFHSSDHIPILLVFGTHYDFRNDSHHSHTIKRFEHLWLQDPQSHTIIREEWFKNHPDTKTKLQHTFDHIYNWGHNTFGNIPKQIKQTHQQLHAKKVNIPTKEDISEIHQMEDKLDKLMKQEETWWAQRAKANWLQHGDMNTSFFHFKASQRKRKNKINFILDHMGNRATSNKDIHHTFMNYFTNIFTSSNPTNMSTALSGISNRILPHMYDHLNQDFSSTEVYQAVHQLKGNAAPGPDGLSAKFFQSYWDTIGDDITNTILNILNKGDNPEPFNDTFICLIPKNKNPTLPADFRPIALCNVILKIITKTIFNRIKPILNNIISPQQSAFLPGRLITDNTLIAFEVFHHLKQSKAKKHGYVGIKLDMAKAYDRIEWSFLEQALLTMGFPTKLVATIMCCVSTVSFSILINGTPSPSFKPHRGIRQGDPLSPYLFILCADVLSSLINHLQATNKVKGISIATNAPPISHLFFADDSILFCRAKKEEATHLMKALEEYQRISGQQINLQKSEMTFSPNLQSNVKADFHAIMPIHITNNIAKYLGMPTTMGRSKIQDFKFLMDKIWSKLKGWKEKNLSFAGRKVLISAVIQAIPTYMMSCFLIPKNICDQIEKAICKFWWGGKVSNNKIHWKARSELFKPSFKGGLGFRDMHLFNKAMLAKQVWRLHVSPTSLLNQILKAKYFPHTDILHSPVGLNPSFTWRSIHQAIWIIKKGSCWTIGTGDQVHIWDDHWLPHQNGYKILTPKADNAITKVSELIQIQPTKEWNSSLIDRIFIPFERDLIKQLPIIQDSIEDYLMWPHTPEGGYTVKSGYNILKHWQDSLHTGSTNTNPNNSVWKKLWTLHTIPRHKALIWRILNKAIPVRSALNSRGIQCPILCPRCLQGEETVSHLFMRCERAKKVWFGSILGINFNTSHRSFIDWLYYCFSTLKEEDLCYLAAIIYGIWFARNLQVFENSDTNDQTILDKAHSNIKDYQLATQDIPTPQHNQSNQQHMNQRTRATNQNQHMHVQQRNQKWRKPRQGEIKGNCDANLTIEGFWGLGAMFRDENGQTLASATWLIPGFSDPLTAEACALYNMTRLAAECCFTNVVLESDCAKVIMQVNELQESHRSYTGNFVRGINRMRGCFQSCSFAHIDRRANKVAHRLASLAHEAHNRVWIEETHPSILPLVILDQF